MPHRKEYVIKSKLNDFTPADITSPKLTKRMPIVIMFSLEVLEDNFPASSPPKQKKIKQTVNTRELLLFGMFPNDLIKSGEIADQA